MAEHAPLSPSASDRWISCPASIRMETKMVEQESVYAAEGTKAHVLGEIEVSHALGMITTRQCMARIKAWRKLLPLLTEEQEQDMFRHIAAYRDLVEERKALHPHTQVLLEQKVHTGIENCFGTADVALVSPVHVEIIDLKYGQGVPVYAHHNSQLMLYGVGALEEFGDVLGDTETVYMTVFQPRLDSTSTYEMSAVELREWRDSIKPIAIEALGENAHFGPSDEACRWCPAAGVCRPRMEYMTQRDFGTDPDLISEEEIAELLHRTPGIRAWCADIEDAALRKAYSEGVHIPGWKVVLSGGKRSIADHEAALELLKKAGYEEEQVVRSITLKTLGDLEKLVGKTRLPFILGDTLKAGEGKPSLAPEDDKRPAISPNGEAERVFAEEPQ